MWGALRDSWHRDAYGQFEPLWADLITHTLLKQEEESPRVERLGIAPTFGILDRALNRSASRRDP